MLKFYGLREVNNTDKEGINMRLKHVNRIWSETSIIIPSQSQGKSLPMSYIAPTTIGTRSARALKATSNMAKSKSFFGLRKGSTKDFTFATYRGQQVTKSRVTSVANPQTLYQMEQRMRLVQVANAATKLKGLINHSFEGVAYGQDSIGRFRAMNLTKGTLTPNSWVPKGVGDCGVADFIISKGSLGSISNEFLDNDKKSNAVVGLKQVATGDSIDETVTSWLQKNDLRDGDQLTFVGGFQNGPSVIVDGKAVYYHNFAVERLIIQLWPDGHLSIGEDANEGWTDTESNLQTTGVVLRGQFFEFAVSTSKESEPLTTNVKFVGQPFASSLNFSFDMFGIILSRKEGDVWRRSFCQMAAKKTSYAIEYDHAANTYIKSTTSNKFLNLGDQKTGILGNQ